MTTVKKKVRVLVSAHFHFDTEVEMDEDDEGLTEEEQVEVEDATMMALASFSYHGQRIGDQDPPVIEVETRTFEPNKENKS